MAENSIKINKGDVFLMAKTREAMIAQAYRIARERYREIGVDTDKAMKRLSRIPISLHCWQGDDVNGFETADAELTGGIQATGNFPGKARNADELRKDLDKALSMIPGVHRLNLHAIYAETGKKKVERNLLLPKHFSGWVQWAAEKGMGLDFNPTCFSHPMMKDGLTLSHPDAEVRRFWIEHCIACRKIGESFGQKLGTPAVTNIWIPDGYKDLPADRAAPRERLAEALDRVFKEKISPRHNLDAVECKLFGIGSESYVVGSHEFYMGYALKHKKLIALDAGHFHPTESIADKITSILLFSKELLLHVSRPVRWDSDHVVVMNDELRMIAEEIIRYRFENRVHIGLDYFDASINRIAAWVIGTRNMLKALLAAILAPNDMMADAERNGDLTTRLAMQEEMKSYPMSAVWDYYCLKADVPVGREWLAQAGEYERDVLLKRG